MLFPFHVRADLLNGDAIVVDVADIEFTMRVPGSGVERRAFAVELEVDRGVFVDFDSREEFPGAFGFGEGDEDFGVDLDEGVVGEAGRIVDASSTDVSRLVPDFDVPKVEAVPVDAEIRFEAVKDDAA